MWNGVNDLLAAVLDCGMNDLVLVEDVQYGFEEIVDRLRVEGIEITLKNIMHEVFVRGQEELAEAVSTAIADRREWQDNIEDTEAGRKEYALIQKET